MEELITSEEEPTGERWDPLGAPNDNGEESSSSQIVEHECCEHSTW